MTNRDLALVDDHGFPSPPHNVEAEQALLGAILIHNNVALEVLDFLLPEHFFEAVHGRVYSACLALIERGQIANPTTLRTFFEKDEALAEIGDADYLRRLAAGTVTIINAEDYGRLILELAQRRELIRLARDLADAAQQPEPDVTAGTLIERAQVSLDAIVGSPDGSNGVQAFADVLEGALASTEAACRDGRGLIGVTTGLPPLDGLLGGLQPGEVVVLASRPAMGKTVTAGHMAIAAAQSGHPTLFFNLEMENEDFGRRAFAAPTDIPYEDMRRGRLREEALVRIRAAAQELRQLPLFLDDTPSLTLQQIRNRSRRVKRESGLKLVVVDYLQLVRPGTRYRGNRVYEVSEISAGLKALAKELNVCVLVLSQLSRGVEQRDDKRPLLSDLRDSGAIEQDADVVIFPFREAYYLERAEPTDPNQREKWEARLADVFGLMELIVAKNRHGRTSIVSVNADMATAKFSVRHKTTGHRS